MIEITAAAAGQEKTRFAVGFAASVALSLSFILIASGVTTNEISYVFLAPIFLLAIPLAKLKFSAPRIAMIALSLVLIAFGTVMGYFVGHEINHIIKFSAPLLAFSIMCMFPGIGRILYENRKIILSLSLVHTLFVFYIVKTGDFVFADRFIPGWTLTYSSNAAVSVWHYFALPFAFSALGILADKKAKLGKIIYFPMGVITIIVLYFLTDTSSYALAAFAITALAISPMALLNLARKASLVAIPLIIIDFFTSKIISNLVVSYMYGLIEDSGDVLRLIQIDYFVRYAEFFGSGFGAAHAFPLEINADRQTSQIIYPYASELPIINIIYNGGILAGIWFFWLAIIVIDLARYRKFDEKICTFGLACSAILFGSVSNPYLFAPASMLLLAVMFDIWDETRGRLRGRRAGATG